MREPYPVGEFALRILIAFFAGALIGLERERTRIKSQSKYDLPGLRSFGLTSILGSLVAFLSLYSEGINGNLVFATGTVGFIVILLFYIIHRMLINNLSGITTYLTLIIAYILGVLAGLGMMVEAVSASILATFVLSVKYPSRRIVRELSYKEFIAALEVGTLSLILGPIIYSLNVSFLGVSVFKVYIFFLVVLWISLVSYFLVKAFGGLGLETSAVLGSLVNSEATIASVASIIGKITDNALRKSLLRIMTLVIIATLHIRSATLTLVAVYTFLNTTAAEELVIPVIIATLPSAALLSIIISRREGVETGERISVESPLNWSGAVKTAIAYAILTLAVYAASSTYTGVLPLIAFLGGLVNAAATIFSLAAYAGTLPLNLVAGSLLLSVASATLNKVFYLPSEMYRSGEWKNVLFTSIIMSIPLFLVAFIEFLIA